MNLPGPNVHDDLPALEVSGIGKRFELFDSPAQRLRQRIFAPGSATNTKWALRGLDFKVARGSAYGIIGRNGSGKSTLLKIICGVMRPTEGQVITRGRVLGLLELGAGLNIELTGRQNVFASTSLLGFPPTYAQERMAEIEAFADIGEFFDNPVKLYSSGMLMRLAFSLYLFMEPDILIVDEALSVGDQQFQKKCAAAMNDIRARGTTLLFVSHSLGTIKAICDRALLLDGGVVTCEGDVDEVLNTYLYPARRSLRQDQEHIRSSGDDVVAGHKRTAAQLLEELVPDLPVVEPDSWQIVAQRTLNGVGAPASLFQMGNVLEYQIVAMGPQNAQLAEIKIELFDRFDRIITGRRVDLAAATGIAWGAGTAVVIVVRMSMDVIAGDYVFRLRLGSGGDDAEGGSAMSGAVSVYNALPFPPFYGIVGLPARFHIEGRAATDSEAHQAASGRD